MFSRIKSNKRLFSSCSYSYEKPMIGPFGSSLLFGSLFYSFYRSLIIDTVTIMHQHNLELKKEISELKQLIQKPK